MIDYIKTSIYLLTVLTLTSCASLKKITSDVNRKELNREDIGQLNGNYKITSTTDTGTTLEHALINKIAEPDSNKTLSLLYLGEHKFKVTLSENDRVLEEKIIKGKIKDSYFIVRRSYKVKFWFILNGLSIQKTRISLLQNNNLTLDTAIDGIGFITFLPCWGSGGEIYGLEYQRVN